MADIAETELDSRALMQALLRSAWLIALVTILCAVATYLALGLVRPLYSADTSVFIEERESPLTRTREDTAPPTGDFDEAAILSQVEIIRSRQIADAVIDKLALDRKAEFDPDAEPSALRSLLMSSGLVEPASDSTLRQRVMQTYYDRLSVFPLQRSRVIGIDFEAGNPELAADIANAIAEAFVTTQQGAKRDSAVAATSWLQQEIERLRGRVTDAERAVADYRARNSLYDVGQGTGSGPSDTNLSTQQLSDINAELARARAARAEAEARARNVEDLLATDGSLDSSPEVLNSALIQRLRERQVALRTQIAELSTTLLPGHPRIRSLNDQIGLLDRQIRDEAGKVLASLNTAARVAAARESSLLASLNAAKNDVSRANGQGIDLRALEREATAQRELLESFLSRYREAIARTDADYLPADARIVSRAIPPREPSYPRKGLLTVAVALAALLLASAFVLLREFSSGRAFRVIMPWAGAPLGHVSSGQVAPPQMPARSAALPARALGALPAAPAHSVAVVDDLEEPDFRMKPNSLAIDGDKPGTDQIAEIMSSNAVRIVLFAGARGGEASGDVALAAAKRATRDYIRVVLIDIGRRPSAALGGAEKPGLGELLNGSASFGEVIRRDDETRVHTIPLGGFDFDAPIQRLQLAVAALTHTYDKVVIAADSLTDWPDEQIKPDLVAIVCEPDMTDLQRAEVFEGALARGAGNALIVRYAAEDEVGGSRASRAA